MISIELGRRESDVVPDPMVVVGIGASAGGLEALTAVVANLPRGGNICYVVAQHMSPQHKSMMVDLLARATLLPVVEAAEGLPLTPGTIHITPPNSNIEIRSGTVVLTGPYAEGPKPSIDLLFVSLAEDRGATVIGIVLSGTGSDGATGMREIKAHGGFTIVQAPDTAKYGGMPEAALRTGKIDKVLPPDQIGKTLAELMAEAPGQLESFFAQLRQGEGQKEFEDDSGPYHSVISLIRQRTNIDFQQYKSGTIQRRIQRRLSANRLLRLEDYVEFLLSHPQEIDRLCSDILISVTSFFRDGPSFEALGLAIGDLLERKPKREPVRVWVPGCATGEEAYTIGMILSEQLHRKGQLRPVQIFAVDIDESVLAIARRATYPLSAVEDMTPELVDRYMTRVDNVYQVDRQLRDIVVFSKQDITRDPPFSHIDIISCRNLLIYFNNELQSRIIRLFAYALNPGGLLFLGKSETLGLDDNEYFKSLNHAHRIFLRSEEQRMPLNQVGGGRVLDISAPRSQQKRKPEGPSLPVMVKSMIGELFGPPGVVVDGHQKVAYIHGDVSRYVRLTEGKFEQDIMSLIAPELRTTLRAVLHRADRDDQQPVNLVVKVPDDGATVSVRISVNPVAGTGGAASDPHRLITFEQLPAEAGPRGEAAEAHVDDPRIAEFEHELMVTREHLQTVIQELESANEELQATNEELQSSNEELQATNEELETTNEELQSTNEELQTINDELEAKSSELLEKATDLQNISTSIESPLIVVDRDLRVRLFNDSARPLFDITLADIGTPVTQLANSLDIPDMRRKFQSVIDSGAHVRADVTDQSGNVYSMSISPYRDDDHKIVGAIFSAANVTDRVRAEANLRELTRQLNEAQRIAHVGSWRWELATDSLTWSPELYRICGLDPDDFTLNHDTALSVYHPDDRQTVRRALDDALRDKTGFGFEARIVRPGGELRTVRVTGLCKLGEAGQAESLFGVIKDITDSVSAAQLLSESHARLTTIMNTIIEGIIVIDVHGVIRLANTAVTKMFGYSEHELVGQNISILMPDPIFRHHDQYITSYLHTGKRKIIGVGREVTGRRKDGTMFPLELSVGEVIDEMATGDANNKHIFIGTLHDITARKRYEEALVVSKRDAEAASEAKSTFLAKMSHELRTPLNAILGFSEILKDQLFGPLNNEKYLRYLQDIHSSGEHLLKLINDILDISRIESGKFRIDEEVVDLAALVEECASIMEGQVESKRQTLIRDVSQKLPRLRADGRSVRQVLLNLLSNAIKFTPEEGTIRVGAEWAPDGSLLLSVADDGAGMTPEEMSIVFQPFSRGGNKMKENEGAGLGLFITKSLVELHGGTLGITSDVGAGTTITASFPTHRVIRL